MKKAKFDKLINELHQLKAETRDKMKRGRGCGRQHQRLVSRLDNLGEIQNALYAGRLQQIAIHIESKIPSLA